MLKNARVTAGQSVVVHPEKNLPALIDFVYSTLATPDDFIWRGEKLLREICDGMLGNVDMQKLFHSICGGDCKEIGYTFEDVIIAF